ncbi:hypothetical protein [Streptomyces sp. NPDC019224]|uniref:hypothetical protein n=1 Tax=Streptomyces sp. NPDC019224 TaxID=3154484 RepID=UPI00340B8E34
MSVEMFGLDVHGFTSRSALTADRPSPRTIRSDHCCRGVLLCLVGSCDVSATVYGATMSFVLPDGMPPGRFLSSGPTHVWVSDEFPQDIDQLWPRLLSDQEARGLVPILCWPDVLGSPLGLNHVDAVRLEEVLATNFAEYRRRRLPFWMDPTPVPVPEGVEPWPHDPGPPFEQWPGLAPQIPTASADPKPEEAAAHLLSWFIETG